MFCVFLRRRPRMHGCAQAVVAQNATPSSDWVPCCDPHFFRRTTRSGPSRASRKVPVHTAPAHAMPLSAAHCLRFRLMRCCHTQFDKALMQVACRKRNRPESALEQGNAIGLSQHERDVRADTVWETESKGRGQEADGTECCTFTARPCVAQISARQRVDETRTTHSILRSVFALWHHNTMCSGHVFALRHLLKPAPRTRLR